MRSIIFVFLGACSYGVLSTFVKLAYRSGFTENEIVTSQILIGFLIMYLISLMAKPFEKKQKKAKLTRQWWILMVVGSMSGLTGVFYYYSLSFIPASLAIILLFQFTWMGVLISSLIEKKWPGKEQLFSLLLLLFGTSLAGNAWHGALQHMTLLGLILGLLSALSYTIFILFSGKSSDVLSPIRRSQIMIFGALVLAIVIYPPSFLWNGALLQGLWIWGIPLAIFGIVIPTLFFAIGIPHISGGLATILSAAELPTAVFMSVVVLKESVNTTQWLGVALILFGIALPEIINKNNWK